ncbi:MAG: TonB-dependent receptor [Alistipes sp.]|nr:TonB-dependent receptor [Alistipes sp.]
MHRKIRHILMLLCTLPAVAGAAARSACVPADSVIRMESVQVTAVKQGLALRELPVAASVLRRTELERRRIATVRDAAQAVPNFHIPEYGSRMTSSLYVRGLGARIDQPVMGLNIDNVPYLNKDTYDLDLTDIDRIEILRGPQSTLFGRNTMGGVINIYTLSPLSYQGVRLGIDYGSGNTQRYRASVYHKIGEQLGFSLSGHYGRSDGFFRNLRTGERCDWERDGGARLKLQYNDNGRLRIENTLAFTALRQGGYPYASAETGRIDYNDPCGYRRTGLSEGLTIRRKAGRFSVTSITGYQYLDDRMTLDQDFLPVSYFTLTQQRHEHAVTEDLILRSEQTSPYRWLFGAFAFFRHTAMEAPVVFKEDGLRHLILDRFEQQGVHAGWESDEFLLDSRFRTPDYGGALYHESTFERGRWRFTAGVRIDLEASRLSYRSRAAAAYWTATSDGTVYPHDLRVDESGRLRQSFVELLPRLAVQLRLGAARRNTLYATVSKGYKAGGFNTQMFSDVLQQLVMKEMGFGSLYDVADVVTYKPEKSWNYEIGAHLSNASHTLESDAALFLIDCRDQQLTVFPEGQITGRMMTNAGRTRSFGGEFSMRATPWEPLALQLSYGYTHATFVRFDTGRADYAGRFIPYAPQHTLHASAAYTIRTHRSWLDAIVVRAAADCTGPLYWNEENSLRQPFYALLEASVRFEHRRWALDLWGRNLTDARYATFCFESIGNSFLQRGRPRTFGVSLSLFL